MKSKRLIKFYFCADKLNEAMDRLILAAACGSANNIYNCEECADKVVGLIEAKYTLSGLWNYLDGVMKGFSGEDKGVLYGYAFSRGGWARLGRERGNAVRKVVVRFMRRAKYLERYSSGAELLDKFYALMGRGENPDEECGEERKTAQS